MEKLADYVKVYQKMMPDELCNKLIEHYDKSEDKIERDDELMKFNELNLMDDVSLLEEFNQMAGLMESAYRKYIKDVFGLFPKRISYEAPRVKRYEAGEGFFNWHTDVASAESGKRMLVMFWYLNDVEEGGATQFLINEKVMSVKPRKGSVVCFPPYFMYPHKGDIPISGPKYVVSSYINLA